MSHTLVTALLVNAGFFGLLAAYAASKGLRARRHFPKWRAAAKRLGLIEQLGNRPFMFTGTIDGFDVSIDTRGVARVGRGAMLSGFQIHRGSPTEYLRSRRVLTGDHAFDEQFVLLGDPLAIAAAMSKSVREELSRIGSGEPGFGANKWSRRDNFDGQRHFEDGTLTLHDDIGRQLPDSIVASIKALLGKAARLSVIDPPAALKHNVLRDDIEEVRLCNLRLLLAHYRDRQVCAQAVDAALKDPAASLRLLAAEALGPAGNGELAQMILDAREPAALRAQLLPAFLRAATPAAAAPVLTASLRDASLRLRDIAAGALAYPHSVIAREPGILDALLDSVALGDDREPANADAPLTLSWGQELVERHRALREMRVHLVRAQAEALGKFSGERSEAALIKLLAHDDEEVTRAAANSLAATGTVRAVEPLLVVARGPIFRGDREAARSAVRTIQARLGDADAGRLSLMDADDRSGAVSLAEQGGALSEPPGEPAAVENSDPAKVRERS